MQYNNYRYRGKGAAPARSQVRGTAEWRTLHDDMLLEVFSHLDDRQIARLASIDKRTRKLARLGIQHHLGLGASQWEVFRAVIERRESVLIMGTPGSGKSHLLKILKARMYNPLVTASTSAAAEKIDAFTIHSALGLGLGDKTAAQIVTSMNKCRYKGVPIIPPCKKCRTLVIDEVSMLTAKLLDLAGDVMIGVRGNLPQLVVSGDPMQLGAVGAKADGVFYEAKLIQRLRTYVLTESFRQTEDSMFLRILNRARLGRAHERDVKWLQTNSSSVVDDSAPRLFCRLVEVYEYNAASLDRLPGVEQEYVNIATGKQRTGTCLSVILKVGARVILDRNVPEYPTLHNGSCGTVKSLAPQSVLVNFDAGIVIRIYPTKQEFEQDGKVVGSLTKLPLMLAFAVSVHRAQGATMDSMAVDLGRCFAAGQAYVALSRVREAKDMQISGLSLWSLNNIDKAALRYYNECAKHAEQRTERHRDRECERDSLDLVGNGDHHVEEGKAPSLPKSTDCSKRRVMVEEEVDDTALCAMMDAYENE